MIVYTHVLLFLRARVHMICQARTRVYQTGSYVVCTDLQTKFAREKPQELVISNAFARIRPCVYFD